MARNFSNWLKAYMEYTRDSESPNAFHFWTGVSTLAGALRRRVWITMRKFQWTPNFYIILVAPAGVARKTTSISIGMRLLSKVPGVRFGPESMTWQALAGSLSDATEHAKYLSPSGEELLTKMSCLTVEIGELGTFLRTDDSQLVSFLIRMWEGQESPPFLHKTKTSGEIEIPNPWLNLVAATTPAWLQENFTEGMIGGGLTSRIVFVYAEAKRQLVPYPDELVETEEYFKLEAALLEDLVQISSLCGPYTLSPEARDWGRSWYARHDDPTQRGAHLASNRYKGYIDRKQTHLHKFAIILAAAKRNERVIELEDLVEAEEIISATEPAMLKVFESIGLVDEARKTLELLSFIRFAGGFMDYETLWYRSMNIMSLKQFKEAVNAAVEGGVLVAQTREGKRGVALKGQS